MIAWLLIAFTACAAFLLWRRIAAGKAALPRAGDALPDFALPDQNGAVRSAADFRGRWLVLYFYPRDDTPGCTEQAARFRDALQEFGAAGRRSAASAWTTARAMPPLRGNTRCPLRCWLTATARWRAALGRCWTLDW